MKIQFLNILENLFNSFKKTSWLLLLASVLLVLGLIVFSNVGLLPMRIGDLIFFSVITLAFGLYRPGWLFLFLISTLAIENINFLPAELSAKIRPYQFIALALTGAITIKLITKKLKFKLITLKWPDFLLLAMGGASFLSALASNQQGSSLKLTLILFSFFIIYFLSRNFIQNSEDVKRIAPFFLAPSLVIVGYGIWQNVRFLNNLGNFEVMPGRPNATFTEADWLGIYLVILISLILSLIYYFSDKKSPVTGKVLSYSFLILSLVILIISVARSAWLATAASIFLFLFIILTNLKFHLKKWQWKIFLSIGASILASIVLAISLVYFFHLTNFQLFNRVQSTASGLQKITIACDSEINLPDKINDVQELQQYNCKHINLENIEEERQAEKFVTEVFRDDPNVNVRAQIYQKAWTQIKQHPVLGIGWGSISEVLGKDERGAGLNASNIFLEIWLGSGIIGLLAFLLFWFYTLFLSIKHFFFSKDLLAKSVALFLIIAWLGFTTANLFNSGIMLGFLWVFLAIPFIKNDYRN